MKRFKDLLEKFRRLLMYDSDGLPAEGVTYQDVLDFYDDTLSKTFCARIDFNVLLNFYNNAMYHNRKNTKNLIKQHLKSKAKSFYDGLSLMDIFRDEESILKCLELCTSLEDTEYLLKTIEVLDMEKFLSEEIILQIIRKITQLHSVGMKKLVKKYN